MVLTAWVSHELVEDRPESKGGSILRRGDNFAAGTLANRCGGARDKRAGLMMRMLGHHENPRGLEVRCKTYFGRSEHVRGRYFTLGPIRTSRQSETVDEHRRLV